MENRNKKYVMAYLLLHLVIGLAGLLLIYLNS